MTDAPTMGAPLGSVTAPVMPAVTSCPHARCAPQVSASNIIITSAIPTDLLFFIANPPIREPRMLHGPAIYSFLPDNRPHPDPLYGLMPCSYIALKYHCQ